jgi:hypothetical protein
MSAVLGVVIVDRPDDDVWSSRGDLLIAARAAVRPSRLRPGQQPHDVILAAPGLHPFGGYRPGTVRWRPRTVLTATVLARHDSIFADVRPQR